MNEPVEGKKDGPLIFIVEDEAKLAAVLADYLGASGYRTHGITDGHKVIAAVRSLEPALILLDLTLPGRDGVDLCRQIRAFTDVPIIMVTARVEEIDRLLGLEVGADDYVCKPFSPREVVARVRTILKRTGALNQPSDVPGLILDEQGQRVSFHGQWLELTAVEYRLLSILASAPGRIFSRDKLVHGLYTDHRSVTSRTVDSHVKNLRRKLEQANPGHVLVRSVYGAGYKLEP